MPYIKMVDRPKFKSFVESMVALVTGGTESTYTQGEYFGFYVNRVVKHFLNDPQYQQQSFNSAFFNEQKKVALISNADHVAALLNRSDPIAAAGDLNYSITAPYWGILGDAENVEDARYGVRTYLNGTLLKILESIETINSGNQRDATLAFRRHLIIKGVLDDVMKETYRRKTAFYEDEKKMENRDIWQAGQLVVPEEAE